MSRKIFVLPITLMFAVVLCADILAQGPPQGRQGRGGVGQGQRAGGQRAGGQRGQSRQRAAAPAVATLPESAMDSFQWRSIGPSNMGGRITSIAVYEADPSTWWAATASGGLLKTTNNGISFEHQFDDQATVSIGDVQVCQSDPNIVWVGTGEANPRNSSSWGDGVYKSTDGGETFTNMGLKGGFQTGRIAINPENPDIVYVGVLGRLWGPNEERGLFKTTDGGTTWEKVLYVDDRTGVVEVQMHPTNPDTLMVATYERKRDGFDGNDPEVKYGAGAAIYRTTDGGANFEKMTEGLPECDLGRVGINYYRSDPSIVYAIIESAKIAQIPDDWGDSGFQGEDADVGVRITSVTEGGAAEKAGLKEGDIIVCVNDEILHAYNDLVVQFRKHKAGDKFALKVARDNETTEMELTLAEISRGGGAAGRGGRGGRGRGRNPFTGTLGGQAANLQGQQGDNEKEHGGVYMSKDGGTSWTRINTLNPRPMYYSQFRVDPSDNSHMYVLGTSQWRSKDGGNEFTGDGGRGVHSDCHAMWIDPKDGRHMILGSDGGIYVTYDRMQTWDHLNTVAIGQFYHVGLDATRDYRVFGGLQDNGSWGAPAQTRYGGARNTDWFNVGGGDGFIVLVDPNDPNQIYAESQNGSMSRIHLVTNDRGSIRPRAPQGVRYRFNWKTPFILSPHSTQIHYSAGNYVFKSNFKGNNVKPISEEITNTDRGAGSAISESPVEEGVIYVGTTDGAVWGTRDGGLSWNEIYVKREAEQSPSDTTETSSDTVVAEPAQPAARVATRSTSGEAAAAEAHPLVGKWNGELLMDQMPERNISFDIVLKEGNLGGSFTTPRSESEINSGKFNQESGEFELVSSTDDREITVSGTVKDGKMTGQLDINGQFQIDFEASKGGAPVKATPISFVSAVAMPQDAVSGLWKGELFAEEIPPEGATFDMTLKLSGSTVTGTVSSPQGDLEISEGSFKAENGQLQLFLSSPEAGIDVELVGKVSGKTLAGVLKINGGQMEADFEANLEKPAAVAEETTAVQESPRPQGARQGRGQRGAGQGRAGRGQGQGRRGQGGGRQRVAAAAQPPVAADDDPVTGRWEGSMISEFFQGEQARLVLVLRRDAEGNVSGTFENFQGNGEVTDGKFDTEKKTVSFVAAGERSDMQFNGNIANDAMNGSVEVGGGRFSLEFEAKRTSTTASAQAQRPAAAAGSKLEELVPGPRWVSSIDASHHEAGRVYLTLDGHRSNDDEPYPFVSEDYGETWRSIRGNLPTSAGSTRVLREDITNENLLFLGCEFSAWVSIDRGQSWTRFKGGLPTVAVHEFAIHPTSGEIVAGTHGRSLWIADISGLRGLSPEVMRRPAALIKPNSVVLWRTTRQTGRTNREFQGENPNRNAEIFYHLAEAAPSATVTISDARGSVIRTFDAESSAGLHMISWNLSPQPAAGQQQPAGRGGRGGFGGGRGRGGRGRTVATGDYLVTLTVGDLNFKELLTIENDPVMPPSITTDEEFLFQRWLNGEEIDDKELEAAGFGKKK